MAENLSIGSLINGKRDQKDNYIIEKYCYKDSEKNCDIYGGLYQWDEMMGYNDRQQSQGICPENWHIPSKDEWMILIAEIQKIEDVDLYLRGGSGQTWKSFNDHPKYSSFFKVLPSGVCKYSKYSTFTVFNELGTSAKFWTSTKKSRNYTIFFGLRDKRNSAKFDTDFKSYGYSVRCIMN